LHEGSYCTTISCHRCPIRHKMMYRMIRRKVLDVEELVVERKKMAKLTPYAAHRAGNLRLPPGYRLEMDADLL
jgi:hypothetical protein